MLALVMVAVATTLVAPVRFVPPLLAPCTAAPCAAARGDDPMQRKKLADGVELAVLTVKDAPLQTFFAFLPTGLALDEAGHAQWAHLLEHMVIRSTDAEGMQDGAIRFNGETGDASVRLDLHAPPAQAAAAAAKLVRWLSVASYDAAVLEREKKNIASEVANTVPRGFGHKWATAAWAQAVRHGATSVAIVGDVERATVESVASYAARTLGLGTQVHLYAAGPLTLDEVAVLFEEPLKKAAAGRAATAADSPPRRIGGELRTGDVAVTWDLPKAHVIEWYLLPDETPEQRIAAIVVANALSMTLQGDTTLPPAGIVPIVTGDVVVPEGRALLFSASLPDAAAAATARAAFRRAIDSLERPPPTGSLATMLTMVKNELAGGFPDWAALRKQWPQPATVDVIEAQLLLSAAAREWSTRLTLPEMAAAAAKLTPQQILDLRAKSLAPAKANSVLLTPAK
jgi:predicted Zn-dependent peptidase